MANDGTRPLSIMVVEDHEDTAESTAALLELWGHAVRVAGNGAAALRGADADMPDVVLLDIALPGMNGWEVARRMRTAARGRQPVVVAVTGYGAAADRVASSDAGIDLHLVKPADPAALARVLDRVKRCLVEDSLAVAVMGT